MCVGGGRGEVWAQEPQGSAHFHPSPPHHQILRLAGPADAARAFGLSDAELSFKDQYASRSGLWRFRQGLLGACVFVGQGVASHGLRMQVRELLSSSRGGGGDAGGAEGGGGSSSSVLSGFVTPQTRLTFRSRSSHLILLVQARWSMGGEGRG